MMAVYFLYTESFEVQAVLNYPGICIGYYGKATFPRQATEKSICACIPDNIYPRLHVGQSRTAGRWGCGLAFGPNRTGIFSFLVSN